ncbi:Calpain-type cysteine protease dek1 [Dinochytrium kinnereticum]|nr:Calpain-type cysteine protease dek1 [Dinochytrium kinnereticum]
MHQCPAGYDEDIWITLPENVQRDVLAMAAEERKMAADEKLAQSLEESTVEPPQYESRIPDGMDEEVWNQLPLDIKEDILNDWRIELEQRKKLKSVPGLLTDGDAASLEEAHSHLTSGLLLDDMESSFAPLSRNMSSDSYASLPLLVGKVGTRSTAATISISWTSERDWKYAHPSSEELYIEEDNYLLGEIFTKDWTDAEFPPTVSSIDGIKSQSEGVKPKPMCKCNPKAVARLRHVQKENVNQGRAFFSCAKGSGKGCNFFTWATDDIGPSHSKRDLAIEFKRLGSVNGYCVVNNTRFRPDDVCQGGVGDCWFLSAMAVVAERGSLISKLLVTKEDASNSFYIVRLFIDGEWKLIRIDNYFAMHPKGFKRKRLSQTDSTESLAFCKSNRKQLWAPIIEKAYAKMHGSYRAISGGQIYEGLFDLTGFPTEAIVFGGLHFNSEMTWGRLLSFFHHKFLMGAVCPMSGDGLIGCHAYSILEVREVLDIKIGRERHIEEYFGGKAPIQPAWNSDGKPLRLLKLRNPWGEKEWKGSFGVGSVEWTDELKRALAYDPLKESGCFWISYHDFLQPNKRGKAYQNYFYSDINLIILRIVDDSSTVSIEDLRFFGPCRASHFDIVLDVDKQRGKTSSSYLLIPFSVEREIALLEEDTYNLEMIGAGGRVRKGRNSPDAPFTLRLMSANAVAVREREWDHSCELSNDGLWDNVERALCESGIINRRAFGSPTLVFRNCLPANHATVQLHVFETCGISLAQVINTSPDTDCFVRMRLRASTKTSTATKAQLWRRIPPKSRAIVASCITPSYEAMSEFRLITVEELGVVVNGHPLEVSDDQIATVYERGLLAARKIK